MLIFCIPTKDVSYFISFPTHSLFAVSLRLIELCLSQIIFYLIVLQILSLMFLSVVSHILNSCNGRYFRHSSLIYESPCNSIAFHLFVLLLVFWSIFYYLWPISQHSIVFQARNFRINHDVCIYVHICDEILSDTVKKIHARVLDRGWAILDDI